MAAAFVFSTKTLNDNWYEDRVQPPGSLTAIGDINSKVTRKYETDIAYVGERYDVLTRIGRVPMKPSFATPDDGFREREKTSLVDYAVPQSRPDYMPKAPEKPKFLNTVNVPEVCFEERRPLPGNPKGFRATLDRHDDQHGQRNWNTAGGDAFGNKLSLANKFSRSEPHLLRPCGVSTQDMEGRVGGMKVGIMCGEEFKDRNIPASDTRTQRAWVYDASLANLHHGGTKPSVVGKPDNHMSLPLGDGAMNKIRQDLADRKGKLFRVATTITKGRGSRPGISIFADDK